MLGGYTVIAVSGYFNPLHIGHIELFKEAKKLGDFLVVIVNNDHQLRLKGRAILMPERERVEIVKSIRYVDGVVLSLDHDKSISETLRTIKPDIFANGGDIDEGNLREAETLKEIGCRAVFGVGGRKIQSSSSIIQRARHHEAYKESLGF